MKITVEKVEGGIGSSAWSARLSIANPAECQLEIGVRGETRQHARSALRNAITMLVRELNAVAGEINN